jgi:sulfoquinovosyltransferase
MLRNFKPDLMHVSSPGFLCFAGVLASKLMQVPLVLSYHTHLPVYARNYGTKSWPLKWLGADMLEVCSWKLIRMVHSNADLTLVTSPQMQDELMVGSSFSSSSAMSRLLTNY